VARTHEHCKSSLTSNTDQLGNRNATHCAVRRGEDDALNCSNNGHCTATVNLSLRNCERTLDNTSQCYSKPKPLNKTVHRS
jgi:hypothetical protein